MGSVVSRVRAIWPRTGSVAASPPVGSASWHSRLTRRHVAVHRRMVLAGVAAARLRALQRGPCHALADQQHVPQVQREVPAGVELPVPLDPGPPGPYPQVGQLLQRLLHLALAADDADQVVHRLLEFLVEGVRVLRRASVVRARLRALRGEGPQRLRGRRVDLDVVHRRAGPGEPRRVLGRVQPGPAAEHQQVGEGVAAEPVGAVHAAGDLTGREQAGHPACRRRVRLDRDTAHHVVTGGPDLHRLGRDVDVRQLLELVVHGRQPAPDDLGGHPGRDVQEDTAVRGAAARLHLGVDGARHLVAGEQLGRAPVVVRVLVPAVALLLRLRRTSP